MEARFQLRQKTPDLSGFKDFGIPDAFGALADEDDGVPPLFEPFIADGMVERNTQEITDFRFGGLGEGITILMSGASCM